MGDENNSKKAKNQFGNMSESTDRFEEYGKNSWIKFYIKGTTFQGKISEIDAEKGEITFDALTQFVHNEKGYVLNIVEKPHRFRIFDIENHSISSEETAKAAVEKQSPFYQRIGKYVTIPSNGSNFIGKVDRVFPAYVELKPFLNYKQGKPYIENQESVSVPISHGVAIIPRTREDLEHIVEEAEDSKPKTKAKFRIFKFFKNKI